MSGVRADAIVIDERRLTQRVDSADVQQTYAEFQKRGGVRDTEVQLIISTTEVSESRASELLELCTVALARLFGSSSDVSVITAQLGNAARVRVSKQAVRGVASAMGLSTLDDIALENFITQRVSTEYQLILLKFNNTDILTTIDLSIEVLASGRKLQVSRAQRFR